METNKQSLKSVLKYLLLYLLIVLVGAPVVVYISSYLVDNYLLGKAVSVDDILNRSLLDDIALIAGNLLIIAVFIKKKYTHLNFSKDLGTMRRNKSLCLWALLLELASILPFNFLIASLNLSDYEMVLASGESQNIIAVVGACLFAPFAEELVMRGGVEEKLLQWKGNAVIAIVLSAFLFGLLHFFPSAILYAFLGGLVTGWVYYVSRNILLCVLMHMVNNGFSCVVEWLQPEMDFTSDKVVFIALFGLLFMALSISNLKRISMK